MIPRGVVTNGIGKRTTGKNALPIDVLLVRSLFTYQPETGQLIWARKKFRSVNRIGDIAGSVLRGKNGKPIGLTVGINRKRYLVHRLIWALVSGKDIPPGIEVDHRNRNPLDNRWDNLRLATPSQNLCNTLRQRDLPKGVSRSKNGRRFRAVIKATAGQVALGTFDTPEEASAAFARAAKAQAGEFARWGAE